MLIIRSAVLIFSVGMMVLGASVVSGQNYPNKPIRIVTSEVGGANDLVVRLIVPGLTSALRQPVIIENRPTIVTSEIVTKALPDGYTLTIQGTSFWIGPLLRKASYDPVRDFSPITLTNMSINVLVVHPSLPATSVKELVALAKARPGALNYGTSGAGAASHLATELFKSMAGVNIARVSYKSAGPALNALIGGEVQLMLTAWGSAATHIKSGKLRALAVTSAKPSALIPDLPTVAASGVPGYESVQYNGIFATGKTPAAIINRLNQEIVRVLNRGDVKEKFAILGTEVVGSSPGEFAATLKSDIVRWGKLIKDTGIRAD